MSRADRGSLVALYRYARPRPAEAPTPAGWCVSELAGRLCELCGDRASAAVTLAFSLVHDAQRRGEPVAWINGGGSSFFPPDVAEGGVDLDALVVVRAPDAAAGARAADQLARSGAFGLLVLDLGADAAVPMALLSRLLGLAQKHDTAVVFLTARSRPALALGSLISLRAEARRQRPGSATSPAAQGRLEGSRPTTSPAVQGRLEGGFTCELTVVKDKRRAPGWTHREAYRGPTGLR